MNAAEKIYMREIGLAMLGYIILLITAISLLPQLAGSIWGYLVMLLPVLPALFGLRAFLHLLERMDELQQRIQLSGIAFAAGATGLLSFAYGFLEIAGLPHLPAIWYFPALIIFWGAGVAIATWRYR